MTLAIFCFYEQDGQVYDYVQSYLLKIRSCVDVIDVIVNGSVSEIGKKFLINIARKVYIRENHGYDAGAYADYFHRWADEAEIRNCERIFFINNTVFGPLVELQEIIDSMIHRSYDFWGIRKVSRSVYDYLESYFLVFERNILCCEVLQEYFAKNRWLATASYQEVLAYFERGLYAWLKHQGFREGSYCDLPYHDIFYSSDYGIIKGNYPFLKKKCLNIYMYGKLQLDIIYKHIMESCYDEKMIDQFMKEAMNQEYICQVVDIDQEKEKLNHCVQLSQFNTDRDTILKFLEKYCSDDIYIYGAGYLGMVLHGCYRYDMKHFSGFLVSDEANARQEKMGYPVLSIADVPCTAVILVGLNRHNTQEVMPILNKGKYRICTLW